MAARSGENNSAVVATGVFGGVAFCCMICVFSLGIPMLIGGGIWLSYTDSEDNIVPIALMAVAGVMILIGIITGILACVCGCQIGKRKKVQQEPTVVAVTSPEALQQANYPRSNTQQPSGASQFSHPQANYPMSNLQQPSAASQFSHPQANYPMSNLQQPSAASQFSHPQANYPTSNLQQPYDASQRSHSQANYPMSNIQQPFGASQFTHPQANYSKSTLQQPVYSIQSDLPNEPPPAYNTAFNQTQQPGQSTNLLSDGPSAPPPVYVPQGVQAYPATSGYN